jgi:hypothetical protein
MISFLFGDNEKATPPVKEEQPIQQHGLHVEEIVDHHTC